MSRSVRRRFWLETACAVLSAALAVLTLISREWIEEVFGVDPDDGSGTLEWSIVFGLLLVATCASIAARSEVRRARRTAISA